MQLALPEDTVAQSAKLAYLDELLPERYSRASVCARAHMHAHERKRLHARRPARPAPDVGSGGWTRLECR